MAHFSMNGPAQGDESSDSDHRQKRRKTNPIGHAKPSGSNSSGPAPAANSFAAKMMAKMGYVEGRGLGATGRGRLAPIESQLRPQGAGLGAVKEKTKQAKEEEKREAAFRGEVIEESSEEEKKRRRKLKEKKVSDGTSAVGTPRRAKPKYKTAADMEAAAEGLEVPHVLMSLIDATGQDTKLLTSTAGLMKSQTMVPSETESSKIARRARRELEGFTDEWTALSERKVYFEAQETQMALEVREDGEESHYLKDMIDAVQDLQRVNLDDDDSDDSHRWEATTDTLESLQKSSAGQSSELKELAVAALHPLFKHAMQEWEPLNPSGERKDGLPYLKKLQHVLIPQQEYNTELVLQNGNAFSVPRSKSTTHYETMIYSLWLPPMRRAINHWDVYQDSDALIDLLKAWKPVLPPFIWANVIDQLVANRLTDAVAAWKPRSAQKSHRNSSKPPHVWLFPWLPHLDEQHTDPNSSMGLLSEVKRKFKSVLSTWSLSTSVPSGLEEWRTVIHSELSSILVRHLLPRLALHLSTKLIIDPSEQDLTPLEDVLRWSPFFPLNTMAHLLIAEFFPKWHQTLYVWLTYEGVNYTDVKNWYGWWKEEILGKALSAEFNELPSIAGEWNKGLETMSQALDLLENGMDVSTHLPAASLDTSYDLSQGTPSISKSTAPGSSGPPPPFPSSTTSHTLKTPQVEEPTTFKDVVEEWCAENGLLLFPLREADLQTGLPLFRITASASGRGGVVVYLKGDVVWVRGIATAGTENRMFMPVGLDETLVAKAEAR